MSYRDYIVFDFEKVLYNKIHYNCNIPNFDGINGATISRAAGHVISQWGTTYVQTYNN